MPYWALLVYHQCIMCCINFRAVYQVKPFPRFIPITIATYKDKDQHLLPELSKVRSLIPDSYHLQDYNICLPSPPPSLSHTSTHPHTKQAWNEGQNKLIHNIHPDCKHIILPGSDYLSLYYHSQATASAILTMVENWRRESKLAA